MGTTIYETGQVLVTRYARGARGGTALQITPQVAAYGYIVIAEPATAIELAAALEAWAREEESARTGAPLGPPDSRLDRLHQSVLDLVATAARLESAIEGEGRAWRGRCDDLATEVQALRNRSHDVGLAVAGLYEQRKADRSADARTVPLLKQPESIP